MPKVKVSSDAYGNLVDAILGNAHVDMGFPMHPVLDALPPGKKANVLRAVGGGDQQGSGLGARGCLRRGRCAGRSVRGGGVVDGDMILRMRILYLDPEGYLELAEKDDWWSWPPQTEEK